MWQNILPFALSLLRCGLTVRAEPVEASEHLTVRAERSC